MITELKDTQSEHDPRKLPIDRVGVKALRYPIQVLDKARSTQSTIANVSLTVDLPHHYKGTHMSRFIEVLNQHGPVLHVDKIRTLARELLARLDAQKAHVEFEFPFFLEKKAPVTGAVGLMDYNVRFYATPDGDTFDFILTVIVPVTTLCPCSKAISAHGAHSQRGRVTFSLRSKIPIWIEDVVHMVEGCASSGLYSLLKRPDEKHVTEQAYDNPVFVEDLVRAVSLKCDAHPDIQWYRVEAENFESIHNHSAYAMIERG